MLEIVESQDKRDSDAHRVDPNRVHVYKASQRPEGVNYQPTFIHPHPTIDNETDEKRTVNWMRALFGGKEVFVLLTAGKDTSEKLNGIRFTPIMQAIAENAQSIDRLLADKINNNGFTHRLSIRRLFASFRKSSPQLPRELDIRVAFPGKYEMSQALANGKQLSATEERVRKDCLVRINAPDFNIEASDGSNENPVECAVEAIHKAFQLAIERLDSPQDKPENRLEELLTEHKICS